MLPPGLWTSHNRHKDALDDWDCVSIIDAVQGGLAGIPGWSRWWQEVASLIEHVCQTPGYSGWLGLSSFNAPVWHRYCPGKARCFTWLKQMVTGGCHLDWERLIDTGMLSMIALSSLYAPVLHRCFLERAGILTGWSRWWQKVVSLTGNVS